MYGLFTPIAALIAKRDAFLTQHSLRFDGTNDYLSLSVPDGDRTKWTWSAWVKIADPSTRTWLFSGGPVGDLNNLFYTMVESSANGNGFRVSWRDGSQTTRTLETNASYDQTDKWYHFVLVVDTAQSSVTDKMKLYVDGVEINTWTTDNRANLPASPTVNQAGVIVLGTYAYDVSSTSARLNGQLAEVHFIDGQALDQTYFGETRGGVWLPKQVTDVTYGNNGFYLDFSQPSSTTNAFDSITWTGTDDATFSIDYLPFTPDLVWAKSRTQAKQHQLLDSVRGNQAVLFSSAADAETNVQSSTNGGLKSIDANGFTIEKGTGSPGNDSLSGAGENIVAWCWKAGGSSNTYNIDDVGYSTASAAGLDAGSITPTGASVNTAAGFSIIGYEGNETSGATVSHGLNQTPELIMVKTRDLASRNWYVGSSYLSSYNNFLYLNTDASSSSSTATFNDTAPTSSVFTLGNSDGTNASSSMIAYCWHSVPGYSKIGSYVANGSSNGPIIRTGFRPAFLMIKNVDSSLSNWIIYDNARNPQTNATKKLGANEAYVENSTSYYGNDTVNIDLLADGFHITTTGINHNNSGDTYIYMAFADTSPNLGVDRTTDGTGVTLLLDGTSTTDKSSANTGLTNNGVAVNQNSQSHPYASGALLFDGSDDLTITTENDNLYLGTDDWTIEGWFRTTNLSTTNTILEYRASGGDNGAGKMFIGVLSNGQVGIYENTVYQAQSATGAIVTNTWYHLAFVRNGGTVSVFIDGSLADSGSLSSWSVDILRPTSRPIIGGFTGGGYNWIGEWVDFRITRGVARYSDTFTPPTSALSADVSGITGSDDVVLLLNGVTATDQSNANTGLTNNGVAVNQNSQSHPYASGALLFDGNNTDDLTITTENDNLYLGTNDWTIEGWFRTTDLSLPNVILEYRASGPTNGAGRILLVLRSTGDIGIYEDSVYQALTATGTIVINTWYHIAFTRKGGNVYIFVNGSLAASGSLSSASVDILRPSGRPLIGGYDGGGANWIGEWVDFRITKGAALYPFHPPISALTNDDTWDKPKNDFSVEGNITPDDQLLDTPNLRFATWDTSTPPSGTTLSNGNLTVTHGTTLSYGNPKSTLSMTSGKYYFECRLDAATDAANYGMMVQVADTGNDWLSGFYTSSGAAWTGVTSSTYGNAMTTVGGIVGIALDADTGTTWFSVNGVWQNGATASGIAAGTDTNYAHTGLNGPFYFAVDDASSADRGIVSTANFGQDHTFAGSKPTLLTPYSDAKGNGEFYYQPPSGFLALATAYK